MLIDKKQYLTEIKEEEKEKEVKERKESKGKDRSRGEKRKWKCTSQLSAE
jgi:hypothetical protein